MQKSRSNSARRRRHERAEAALQRMLEFQEAKSRCFVFESYDPREAMRKHSAEVRRQLEQIAPIKSNTRVLEVGSGAHGLIFFFDASCRVGIDPLAHHYLKLFPDWQRRALTLSAKGEALPFAEKSFDVVLSDDVVDYAEDPEEILKEMTRVLAPSGMLYFTVNICHPIWNALSLVRRVEDFHTTHISLRRAQDLFAALPLQIVWQQHNIKETRNEIKERKERRLQAWVKNIFYYKARLTIIAVRETK